MDHKSRESGHLMLITPERVFYAGLLGRPRQRCLGAFHVYVSIKGGLRLAVEGAAEGYGELAVVLPNLRHSVASDYRSVICVLIEPESVCPGALDQLAKRMAGNERQVYVERIRAVYARLLHEPCGGDIVSTAFDTICFGEALPRRDLDPRVVRAIAQIGRFSGDPVTAASCAAAAGLSSSRFLHLFKQETGISFRCFRAWKRARHLLHFANQDLNLAHLAQEIGYPELDPFQSLDPALLRAEAARDLLGLPRPRDLRRGRSGR